MVPTPYLNMGLVWVKYGFSLGSVRVGKNQVFTIKPGFSSEFYGLVRVKYGFSTGSVRVFFPTLFFSEKFLSYTMLCYMFDYGRLLNLSQTLTDMGNPHHSCSGMNGSQS